MELRVRRAWAVAFLLAGLSLGGCARSEPASSDAEPAQIQPIAGSSLHRVVLTERASENLGMRTQPVLRATAAASSNLTASATATASTGAAAPATPARTRARTSIPLTAVVYDPAGRPWTYIALATRTFVRAPIVIDYMSGGRAYLISGPRLGTAVVTVGASELLGAEYGVGGE